MIAVRRQPVYERYKARHSALCAILEKGQLAHKTSRIRIGVVRGDMWRCQTSTFGMA